MWKKLVMSALIATAGSSYCLAQGAADMPAAVSACAKDTAAADCPATYQALRASDCLRQEGNRACLVQMAKEAAAANNCNRAYQLVYACQCNPRDEAARDSIKAAGPEAVCKYLRGG